MTDDWLAIFCIGPVLRFIRVFPLCKTENVADILPKMEGLLREKCAGHQSLRVGLCSLTVMQRSERAQIYRGSQLGKYVVLNLID